MGDAPGTGAQPTQVVAPTHAQWGAVWALGIGVASLSTAEMLPMSLLTLISQGLGISEGMAGQAVTAVAVVALVTSLVIAPVIKATDRRWILLGLSLAQVLSNTAAAAAPTYGLLIAARLILGLSLGGFWALSASLTLRLVPKADVPRALSIIFGGGAMAGIAAAPLGSFLGTYIGWRGVFAAAAVLAGIAFATQYATLPHMPATGVTRLADLVRVIRLPHIALGMVGVVLTFGGAQTFATYLRPFLESVTGVSPGGVSAALFVLGAFNFLGTSNAARFLHRDLRSTIALVCIVLAIDAALLYVFGSDARMVFVLLAIWGSARGVLAPGWSTWLTRTIPDRAESGGGILVAVIQIAVMAGAGFGGAVTDAVGSRGTVAVSGVVLLVGALHVHFGLRSDRAVTAEVAILSVNDREDAGFDSNAEVAILGRNRENPLQIQVGDKQPDHGSVSSAAARPLTSPSLPSIT